MNNTGNCSRFVILLAFTLWCATACPADTIISTSTSEATSPGVPVNTLELVDLGIDPDFFLFTGNSSYDYNGTYQVQVIGADIDPAKSTTLEGVTTSQVLLTIDQGGSTVANNFSSAVTPGAAPEPGSLALCAAGCLLPLLYFGVKDHAWRSSANRR